MKISILFNYNKSINIKYNDYCKLYDAQIIIKNDDYIDAYGNCWDNLEDCLEDCLKG